MVPKVVQHNGAHELFMNTYVIVGQWYYYIDAYKLEVYHAHAVGLVDGV